MVSLAWTPAARGDFKRLYLDLGRVNPAAAERYAAEIQQKILRLVEYPFLGSRRRDIFEAARLLVAALYLILYQTVPDLDEGAVSGVQIVRIVDGRRDLQELF